VAGDFNCNLDSTVAQLIATLSVNYSLLRNGKQGKPHSGPVFDSRQQSRLKYRKKELGSVILLYSGLYK